MFCFRFGGRKRDFFPPSFELSPDAVIVAIQNLRSIWNFIWNSIEDAVIKCDSLAFVKVVEELSSVSDLIIRNHSD